jgi:hypothetical protein
MLAKRACCRRKRGSGGGHIIDEQHSWQCSGRSKGSRIEAKTPLQLLQAYRAVLAPLG